MPRNHYKTSFTAAFGLLLSSEAGATKLTPPPEGPPTAENWQAFYPQICDVDPKDSYALRAVIFPPQFQTYLEDLPQLPPETETIYIPGYRNEDGTMTPAQTITRAVPDMRHPKVKRRALPEQYIAFLDSNDKLVTLTGEAIGGDVQMPTLSTKATLTFDTGKSETVVWSRRVKGDTVARDLVDAAHQRLESAPLCSYVEIDAAYETVEQMQREAQENGRYECNPDGGYKFSPPVITERVVKRRVVARPDGGTYMLKNKDGKITSGVTGNDYAHFQSIISDRTECDWQVAPEIKR